MAYVLIVDDEPDSSEFVSRFLEQHGFETRCASDGREALKHLINHHADAVVLDVRMPDMDGLTLLEVLRSYLRWQNLPIIMLTAHATPQQIEQAKELGACRVFQKADFKLVDLLECLREKLAPPPPQQQEGYDAL